MLALVVYIAYIIYTPLCWWYRKSEHHFANDQFSLLFLDVKLPDSPGLWSITWEVPERVSFTK